MIGNESTGAKILKNALSAICFILIFSLSLSVIAASTVRMSLSKKNIKDLIDETDIKEITEDIDFERTFNSDLTSKGLRKLMRNRKVKRFAVNIISEYADYIVTGDRPEGIEYDDIAELISENEDDFEAALGYEMTVEKYDSIRRNFENARDELELVLNGRIDRIDEIRSLRIRCSLAAILFYIAAIVGLSVLVFIIRKKSIKSLIGIAVSLMLPAVVFALVLLLGSALMSIIAPSGQSAVWLKAIISTISGAAITSCLAAIATGLVLIGIYAVLNRIRSKKLIKN